MWKLIIMKKLLFSSFILFMGCSPGTDEEIKTCNCNLQQYKRTVITKIHSDGSLSPYSDSGWNKNGGLEQDSEKDCSKNNQIKNETSQTDTSSEYQRDIYLKWVYVCN